MKPVEIVTIEKLIPIFKNIEGIPQAANAIEVARVKDSEGNSSEFNIIVGKGLYNIGDPVVYIQPDYCIPPTTLFQEYYAPNGDMKKSKLGKRGRIRAVKFNFQFEGEMDPIYSNGIILPSELVNTFIYQKLKSEGVQPNSEGVYEADLQEQLQVIKYVAEDSLEGGGNKSGLTKGVLPSFLYATDEPRIESFKKHVDLVFEEGEELEGSIKVDGSSTTIYCRRDPVEGPTSGICSRNQEKKLDQTQTTGYKDVDGIILHQFYNKEVEIRGWKNDFTGKFYTNEEVATLNLEAVEIDVRDAWIDTCKDKGYYEGLIEYCNKYNVQLAIRGELIGKGNKGSGNKLNWDAKRDIDIVWFGVDDLSSGHATRIHYGQEHNLSKVCTELGFERTKVVFEGKYNYDDLIKICNEIFKKTKADTGQVIEGIVIRSKYSNRLSCKYINPEYDEFS